jgi:hypothetical protein
MDLYNCKASRSSSLLQQCLKVPAVIIYVPSVFRTNECAPESILYFYALNFTFCYSNLIILFCKELMMRVNSLLHRAQKVFAMVSPYGTWLMWVLPAAPSQSGTLVFKFIKTTDGTLLLDVPQWVLKPNSAKTSLAVFLQCSPLLSVH